MVTEVVVKLELGHIAKAKDIPTLDGHTHDWIVFVKGADGIKIEYFVEKVVFWLHESYNPPTCVRKQPPYEVKQSGYAGFNLLIDIHFKNESLPKSVRFEYDLFLHTEDLPPVNHTRVEMLTFTSPAEDFTKKLLQAGGELRKRDSPRKEKKHKDKSKETRRSHNESMKHRHSSEKRDKDKSRSKNVHKSHTSSRHEAKEDTKKSHAVDNDSVKKKKLSEKSSSSLSGDKKHKEKIEKLKQKFDSSIQRSLFSRDDSIDIKQIKKEAPKKDEQLKKAKEKKSSPAFIGIKVKKEASERPEKSAPPEKKKKNSKQHHESSKPSADASLSGKVKKRRTVSSSSDSDREPVHPRKKVFRSGSDNSSDEMRSKKKRKHEKQDRHKREKQESKTSVKKMKKKVQEKQMPAPHHTMPVTGANTEVTDMDISNTPPSDRETAVPPPSRKEFAVKEKKRKHVKKREQTIRRSLSPVVFRPTEDFHQDSYSERSSLKKSKHSQRSENTKRVEKKTGGSSVKRKTSAKDSPPMKENPRPGTSESDGSSDDDDKQNRKPFVNLRNLPGSPASFHPSPSPRNSPIPPVFNPAPKADATSPSSDDAFYQKPPANENERDRRISSSSSSDENGGLFDPSPEHDNVQNVTVEMSDEEQQTETFDHTVQAKAEHPAARPPSPLVTVSVGAEPKSFPGMTTEVFEQLRSLQNLLSQVTDVAITEKVARIVRKCGQFATDGSAMDFDLCALDRKTISKIQKCLKAS